MRKYITSDFLTTVSSAQMYESFKWLTLWIAFLQKGQQNTLLKEDLQNIFGQYAKIDIFYNARTALYQYLKTKNISAKEVIVSSYTCVSVSNAIIQAGYIPKYVDIETDTYGLDIGEIEKIENHDQIGCIVLQHTFGNMSRDTKKIITWAKPKHILVIEDVAHSFGVGKKQDMLGLLGDAALFSTGRDKVISSVNGGILIQNRDIVDIPEGKLPPFYMTIQNHFYNIFGFIASKTYGVTKVGQLLMLLSHKLGLFPTILSKKEKKSQERKLNYALPNSLAFLLRSELKRLVNYTYLRKAHGELYKNMLENKWKILDTFTDGNAFRIVCECSSETERKKLFLYMKKNGVILGKSWSGKNIAPVGSDLKNAGYTQGSCPFAEDVASKIVFLPASFHHSREQILYVIELLNNFKR